MPAAKDVAPTKWATNREVLFDNDIYSVIAGDYEGEWRLGERWNGPGDELGGYCQLLWNGARRAA